MDLWLNWVSFCATFQLVIFALFCNNTCMRTHPDFIYASVRLIQKRTAIYIYAEMSTFQNVCLLHDDMTFEHFFYDISNSKLWLNPSLAYAFPITLTLVHVWNACDELFACVNYYFTYILLMNDWKKHRSDETNVKPSHVCFFFSTVSLIKLNNKKKLLEKEKEVEKKKLHGLIRIHPMIRLFLGGFVIMRYDQE